jgi:hypothetical protein
MNPAAPVTNAQFIQRLLGEKWRYGNQKCSVIHRCAVC